MCEIIISSLCIALALVTMSKETFDWYHNDIVTKAKAMHKEEMIISHINGQAEHDQLEYRDSVKNVAEQYYNETFGGTP